MKLCKDCKHARRSILDKLLFGWEFAKCAACPDFGGDSYVDGRGGLYCSSARSSGRCGPDAKLFEERA